MLALVRGHAGSTGTTTHTTSQTVSAVYPAANNASVPLNRKITVTLGEAMDSSSLTATTQFPDRIHPGEARRSVHLIMRGKILSGGSHDQKDDRWL